MKFINPLNVVSQIGLKAGQAVADFGSGGGFFTVAAAKLVGNSGVVYAIDVQSAKLTATQSAAGHQGLKNVQVVKADLEKPLLDLEETSCDVVIMASILHEIGSREMLLKNAYRVLKTGGKILATEWKPNHTPFGPPLDKRISQEDLEKEFEKIGLRKIKSIPADTYHYAVLFEK